MIKLILEQGLVRLWDVTDLADVERKILVISNNAFLPV
ncbi:hypothetical protein TUMEXPCC7403_05430 [Tumidithrix helvetica PCC 7403]